MGIPKFFRWISERYPCINKLVSDHEIPEFDNLYLDMNGIIHTCSHPNDFDPHFRISEEQIFKDIFSYIDTLFCIIKPQKLFFMAVDGVAPRAKMNQQRGRRFRSAKDAELQELAARSRGENLPDEKPFDSNCITPGTEFMTRLQQHLEYFVVQKMSSNKLWQKPQIILSGHQTPGEGEHKIMDYIRWLKAQPNSNPNTRHCLYGLDADLMMLGLCTHEPHFALLREEVKFTKVQKRMSSAAETKFFLLHLSLMREYLDLEFATLKNALSFNYNLENIIDDWILMGFLVGNDFIPNLPGLNISNGALPMLYETYIKVLPTLDGYLNKGGILNLARFEKFMMQMGEFDRQQFEENYADLKYFEGKQLGQPHTSMATVSDWNKPYRVTKDAGYSDLLNSVDDFFGAADSNSSSVEMLDVEEEFDTKDLEFIHLKKDHYVNKMKYSQLTPKVLREQAECYIRAIQWNLCYYYHGVKSWSWYYPHHYAPFISDIRGFVEMDIKFELGEPFLPFQQLLAVLPAACKDLLPKAYHDLMISPLSPIIKYYPSDFETDLNGKRQEWEAIVLIPFINEKRLLEAMLPCDRNITIAEYERNCHGPMLRFDFSVESLGQYKAPLYFPGISNHHAKMTPIYPKDIYVPYDKLVLGLNPLYDPNVYMTGFPTLNNLKFKAKFMTNKVRVFERPTNQDTMVLQIMKNETNALLDVYPILGKCVYVGYPHLVQAKVVSISDNNMILILKKEEETDLGSKEPNFTYREVTHEEASLFRSSQRDLSEHHMVRMGIDIGEINLLLMVQKLEGRKYIFSNPGKVIMEKQWSNNPTAYPMQLTVPKLVVAMQEFPHYQTLDEFFPAGSICFMLGRPDYGCEIKVISIVNNNIYGKLQEMEDLSLVNFKEVLSKKKLEYKSSYESSRYLGIPQNVVSSITGSIWIDVPHKGEAKAVNIGLNLKFNKSLQEVPGYSKKLPHAWVYSMKTLSLIIEYRELFPRIFYFLGTQSNRKLPNIILSDLFPVDGDSMLSDVQVWLRDLPCRKVETQPWLTQSLEPEEVDRLERRIISWQKPIPRERNVMVDPQVVFKPGMLMGNLTPDDGTQYELYDRVINVRESIPVPLGLTGTVTAINTTNNNIDVLFDEEFKGGMLLNCLTHRGYRLSMNSLLNVSFRRKEKHQIIGRAIGIVPSRNSRSPTSVKASHATRPMTKAKESQQLTYAGAAKHVSTGTAKNFPVDDKKKAEENAVFRKMWEDLKATHTLVMNLSRGINPPAECTTERSVEPKKEPYILTSPDDYKEKLPSLQEPDASPQAVAETLDGDIGSSLLRQILGMEIDESLPGPQREVVPSCVKNFFEQARTIPTETRPDIKTSSCNAVRLTELWKEKGYPDDPMVTFEKDPTNPNLIVGVIDLLNNGKLHGPPAESQLMAVENVVFLAICRIKEIPDYSPAVTNLPSPPEQWFLSDPIMENLSSTPNYPFTQEQLDNSAVHQSKSPKPDVCAVRATSNPLSGGAAASKPEQGGSVARGFQISDPYNSGLHTGCYKADKLSNVRVQRVENRCDPRENSSNEMPQQPHRQELHQQPCPEFYQQPRHEFHQQPRHEFHQQPRLEFHQQPRHEFHQQPRHEFHQQPRHNFQQQQQQRFHHYMGQNQLQQAMRNPWNNRQFRGSQPPPFGNPRGAQNRGGFQYPQRFSTPRFASRGASYSGHSPFYASSGERVNFPTPPFMPQEKTKSSTPQFVPHAVTIQQARSKEQTLKKTAEPKKKVDIEQKNDLKPSIQDKQSTSPAPMVLSVPLLALNQSTDVTQTGNPLLIKKADKSVIKKADELPTKKADECIAPFATDTATTITTPSTVAPGADSEEQTPLKAFQPPRRKSRLAIKFTNPLD